MKYVSVRPSSEFGHVLHLKSCKLTANSCLYSKMGWCTLKNEVKMDCVFQTHFKCVAVRCWKWLTIELKKKKISFTFVFPCIFENRCTFITLFLMSQGLIDPSFVTVTEKKNPKVPLTVLFLSSPLLSFLLRLSFTIHYMCVTGYRRVERGEQCVVTLCAALQLSALAPAPSSSRPWGAWPPPLRPTPSLLPALPPPIHLHQNQSLCDTIQTIRWSPCITVYSAPPTMTGHVAQDWERGSRSKMERVITGKYSIEMVKQRGKERRRRKKKSMNNGQFDRINSCLLTSLG